MARVECLPGDRGNLIEPEFEIALDTHQTSVLIYSHS